MEILKPNLSSSLFSLTVERIIAVSSTDLFKAWTTGWDSWFAAPGTVITQGEENTVFFFATKFEDTYHPHYGRFLRIEQDRLVELTWVTGSGGTKGVETVVTVEFEDAGPQTKLRLIHAGFPDEESRNKHEQAWPFVLEQLEERMTVE